MANFKRLKTWLVRSHIPFELGYSEVEVPGTFCKERRQDFIILTNSDIQIYDDESGLTLDMDREGVEVYDDNSELYKRIFEVL